MFKVQRIVIQFRQFSLTQIDRKNHYDTLGITPNATITEIKKAYYNLSMIYHPDKTDGSNESLEKFRSVTEAYEVLSNLNSKRLYDKGVLKSPPPIVRKPAPKKKPIIIPNPGSRSTIYNFDLWTKHHYGKTFQRRVATKQRFADIQLEKEITVPENKALIVVCSLLALVGASYVLFEIIFPDNDIPAKSEKYTSRK